MAFAVPGVGRDGQHLARPKSSHRPSLRQLGTAAQPLASSSDATASTSGRGTSCPRFISMVPQRCVHDQFAQTRVRPKTRL